MKKERVLALRLHRPPCQCHHCTELETIANEVERQRSLLATCYLAVSNVRDNLLTDSRTTQYDKLGRMLEEFAHDTRLPEHKMRNDITLIEDLPPITVRAAKILAAAGITRVDQLRRCTDADLLALDLAPIHRVCHELSGTCVMILKDSDTVCTPENCVSMKAAFGTSVKSPNAPPYPSTGMQTVENEPDLTQNGVFDIIRDWLSADQPKQILSPSGGAVWATAPDASWNLRDQPWPELDVLVETCLTSRGQDPQQHGFGRARLWARLPNGMSEWRNERGEKLAFNPDFWRPIRGATIGDGQ